MFSFRTTTIEDQLDKALTGGKVGVFCSQNCWDPAGGRYLYDIFRERGNLKALFLPNEPELSEWESHIEFDLDQIAGLNAIVVEIQDCGTRYCSHTLDVLRLMTAMNTLGDEAPALYIVDHVNPSGRIVEGTMPALGADMFTPKVAHRHGLTLGELCHLYHNEIGATYALHIISAALSAAGRVLMPWSIPPQGNLPGLFSAPLYSGGAFWEGTSVTPGTGTARPYEYIGAPWLSPRTDIPQAPGAVMRPSTFSPAFGKYAGEKCFGWQIILVPGEEYHSILHTLQIMKFFQDHYSMFTIGEECYARIADPVIEAFLKGQITFDIVREHIKLEEQKWIRKAKRYVLYSDSPCRIK